MADDSNNNVQMSKEQIDQARLKLEKDKFEFEKGKTQKDEVSVSRRLGVSLAIAGTFVSIVTGLIQLYVNNQRAAEERNMALGKVLLEHGPKIYSDNKTERAFVVEVIKITSCNPKASNAIFEKFALATDKKDIKDQLKDAQEIKKPTKSVSAAKTISTSDASLPQDISFSVKEKEIKTGLYRFVIEVSAPEQSLARIQSVNYLIEHPSFDQKNYPGTGRNFSMTYDGWGALDQVIATITLNTGQRLSANINMIKQLGWWIQIASAPREVLSGLPDAGNELFAVEINRGDSLLNGPKLTEIIVSETGKMARMNTVSPKMFVKVKRWLAEQENRDQLKKRRDMLQADIVEHLIEEYLLGYKESAQ